MTGSTTYKTGDIISIPLSDGWFAFARLYDRATLAVFNHLAKSVPNLQELLNSGLAFFAAFFDSAIESGEWEKIGYIPFASVEESQPPPTFARDFFDPESFQILEGGSARPASKDEIEGLDEFVMYQPESLVNRIEKVLLNE